MFPLLIQNALLDLNSREFKLEVTIVMLMYAKVHIHKTSRSFLKHYFILKGLETSKSSKNNSHQNLNVNSLLSDDFIGHNKECD
jgi:hypothetical protein